MWLFINLKFNINSKNGIWPSVLFKSYFKADSEHWNESNKPWTKKLFQHYWWLIALLTLVELLTDTVLVELLTHTVLVELLTHAVLVELLTQHCFGGIANPHCFGGIVNPHCLNGFYDINVMFLLIVFTVEFLNPEYCTCTWFKTYRNNSLHHYTRFFFGWGWGYNYT